MKSKLGKGLGSLLSGSVKDDLIRSVIVVSFQNVESLAVILIFRIDLDQHTDKLP